MKRSHIVIAFLLFILMTCDDFLALLLTTPVLFIAGRQIWQIQSEQFTVTDMFWFCIFLFFGVVPAQAFRSGYFSDFSSTAGFLFSYMDFGIAIAIVVVFLLAFLSAKRLVPSMSVGLIDMWKNEYKFHFGIFFSLFFISVSAFVGYVVFAGGISSVLSARVDRDVESVNFLAYLFLGLEVACNLHLINMYQKAPKRMLVFSFLRAFSLLLQLVAINIYNSPRFFLVGSWLPIMLLSFRSMLSFKSIYAFILFGLFVLMPVLSITTRYGIAGNENYTLDLDRNFFLIRDVDVFETLTYMVGYVEHAGYKFGDNLLAIFLFFVPRDFWPGKPIVGGLLVGWDLYNSGIATTPNLSFFVAGDLFMDFGWIGVVLGGAALGYVFYYFTLIKYWRESYYLDSLVLIGVLPILLRGPVGAVIGYPLCILVCTRVLSYIDKINISRR